ncbi:acid phosphatase precursor [Metarhizium album ARSEF 1941]|uniref:Acid phosphatase n=1 Tax=Metarhizium album (strain ARSEF 1941) TaxID=1081103 RepID=A0A0B2WGR2_METAS|nr:acid phosphatase precursor [Metarhizium album ARSEF 1941]KHN95191.1 acid phosphatase precursor [Metarhizium album ARSEF 1941]
MRPSVLLAGSTLGFASSSRAINILLNNDDGFGSGNLREVYRLLKNAGHNGQSSRATGNRHLQLMEAVWIVAPAVDQSGRGGRSYFTKLGNLSGPSQHDIVPEGAPSIGTDPHDSHIWYYNGTPVACTLVALDYVLPRHAPFKVPDLVVSGPNFGPNLGPFYWTAAGTAGASYVATERSVASIAISARNKDVAYFDIKDENNEATWAAKVSVKIIEQVIRSAPAGGPLLPLGYGLSVNIPVLTANSSDPEIVQTRMTGDADIYEAVFDPATGVFDWVNIKPYAVALNTCVNGDCALPGETNVVKNGRVSVSVYITDYDAPVTEHAESIMERVRPLTNKGREAAQVQRADVLGK